MRPVTRAVSVVSFGALLAGGLSLGTASAAPTATCGYPPAQCGITFDKGSYFPLDTVSFRSGKAFKVGETVDGVLHCRHDFRRLEGPWTAGKRHRVTQHFTLPKHTPTRTCTFTLVGETSGSTAKGSFTVKHHH